MKVPLQGLATLEAVAKAANEPELMGYGSTYAQDELFKQTGLIPGAIDIIELNEAFPPQAVAVIASPSCTGAIGSTVELSLAVARAQQPADVEGVVRVLGGDDPRVDRSPTAGTAQLPEGYVGVNVELRGRGDLAAGRL